MKLSRLEKVDLRNVWKHEAFFVIKINRVKKMKRHQAVFYAVFAFFRNNYRGLIVKSFVADSQRMYAGYLCRTLDLETAITHTVSKSFVKLTAQCFRRYH